MLVSLYCLPNMRSEDIKGGPAVFSAKNLVRIRKERQLSQEGVARLSGLATVTVSKLEEGKSSDPRMSTVWKLAKALGCPVEALSSEDSEVARGGGRA